MNINKYQKYIMTSLFTALIVVISVMIAIPCGNGYLNIGDTFCMLSILFLGPLFGTLSAVTGNLISDAVTGYIIYIPATVVIKAACVLVFYLFYNKTNKPLVKILSYLSYAFILCSGYFLYEYFIIGVNKLALAGIPYNLLQILISSILTSLLYNALKRIKNRKERYNG